MVRHVQVPDPSSSIPATTTTSTAASKSSPATVAEHRETSAEPAIAAIDESEVSGALPPGELPPVSALEMAELRSMDSHSSDRGETGSSESGDEAPAESADECADEDAYANLSLASDHKPPTPDGAAANSGASPERLGSACLSDYLVVDASGNTLPSEVPNLIESSVAPNRLEGSCSLLKPQRTSPLTSQTSRLKPGMFTITNMYE